MSDLRTLLQEQAERLELIGFAAVSTRFVLRHGRAYEAAALPRGVGRGQIKGCYMNAAKLATRRLVLTYVEGFAMLPDVPGWVFEHAWCADERGRVVDNTLDAPEVCQYFGVPFTHEVLAAELLRNQVYGLLDIGRGANLDLIGRLDPELIAQAQEIRANYERTRDARATKPQAKR